MEEYIKEAEKVSFDDNGFGESYDKELAFKEECYNDGVIAGQEIGERRGEKRGEEEGKKQKSIEICKNMLNEKFSVEIISKITGLSPKEIKKYN